MTLAELRARLETRTVETDACPPTARIAAGECQVAERAGAKP